MRKEQSKIHPEWAMDYALEFFTPYELARLNCGDYHDVHHALYVAEDVTALASRTGRSRERATFLAQVALLHDADPREPGTAADVRRTLDWMERHKGALCHRLSWLGTQFDEALALIARTDFPYGHVAVDTGGVFDGLSPVEVYELLLGRLPLASISQTLEDAQLLRFADQTANYSRGWETASCCLDGLVTEKRLAGLETDRYSLNTASFLSQVGEDNRYDRWVAFRLGVTTPHFFTRNELVERLDLTRAAELRRNILRFKAEHYAAA